MIFIVKIILNLLCLVMTFAWKAGYTFSTFSVFKIHNSVSLWVKITRKLNSFVPRAKTKQQLCNRMWCHKSVDYRSIYELSLSRAPPPGENWYILYNDCAYIIQNYGWFVIPIGNHQCKKKIGRSFNFATSLRHIFVLHTYLILNR